MVNFHKILSLKVKIFEKIDRTILLLLVFLIILFSLFFYLSFVEKKIREYNSLHDKLSTLEIIDKDFNNFALLIDEFKNYNKLNENVHLFQNTLTQLESDILKQYPHNIEIQQKVKNIEKTFINKTENLEYFKSLNSTLINTSHFLFDLQRTISDNTKISPETKNVINETLFYLLKYTTTNYINKRLLTSHLKEILKRSQNKDEALVYNFYTHAKLMLATLATLKETSHEIQTDSLYKTIHTLHTQLDTIYHHNLKTNKHLTLLFFISAILLVIILLREHLQSIKAERELYAFKYAVEHSDNTIVITNPQRDITFVNDVFTKITGYTKEEALGQNPNILKSGKQNDDFYHELNQKLDKGEKWEGEFINKRKDGSLYYENASIVPILSHKKLTGYLAIKLDVTKYVQQNKELALAASVFENIEEAIIITDAQRKTISVNDAFCKIYGYNSEEMQGQTLKVLYSGLQDSLFYSHMWKELEEHTLWRGKIINKTKGGSLIPVWSTIKKITDKNGEVINYISVQTDIRELESSQKRIDYLAYHDQLTGLYNRNHFEDYLAHALLLAQRNKENLALLFVDLDRFKIINDTLGHDIGDKVLVEIAKRLQHILRESDFIARWGGDEFVIILENIHAAKDSAKVAAHIINTLKEPIIIEPYNLTTTASVGIALYPENGEDANTLIKHADSAMYLAKDKGKNTFRYYTQELSNEIQSRLNIDLALRNALQNSEFYMVFQPQYSLATGKLISLEALIRWENDELGFIQPDKFIPIAEESGSIVNIGYFVFEESCKALVQMRHKGINVHYIAINVASMQFKEPNLLHIFLSLLKTYNLKASDIEIEITERFIMEPTFENMALLQRFREHGFRISIDDFGTGYSSMAYLKNLPADTIKIDKAFVDGIEEKSADNVIIEAIIALSKTLGYSIVAEGIEKQEQEDFLHAKECDYGQGYLFSKPLRESELIEKFSKF